MINLVKPFADLMIWFLKWGLILLSPWIVTITFWFIYYYIRGYRFKKGVSKSVKRRNKLKRLFVDFPRRFVLDRYGNNPDEFKEYGVHVIAGDQGAGKSIAMTYLLRGWQKAYPKLRVKSNYNYKYQDGIIAHWRDIVASENGVYGEIDAIDEIQNWFSSLESKDFPPEMMTEITQQRKQRKIILSTSQRFSRISKPIREQITYLYEPITLFGCLTIVKKYKPVINSTTGEIKKQNLRQIFFFVHDEQIRESFDTYEKIDKWAKEGFKQDADRLVGDVVVVNKEKRKGR